MFKISKIDKSWTMTRSDFLSRFTTSPVARRSRNNNIRTLATYSF